MVLVNSMIMTGAMETAANLFLSKFPLRSHFNLLARCLAESAKPLPLAGSASSQALPSNPLLVLSLGRTSVAPARSRRPIPSMFQLRDFDAMRLPS